MPIDAKSLGIDRMSIEERLELLDVLLDSVEAEGVVPELSAEQIAELDRRLADMEANPDAGVPWEEVKAKSMALLRK